MQAGFGLEPLAGEAGGDGGACGGADAAEGQVACGPGFGAGCVGAEHWPSDVVGADEGGYSAFDHRDGLALQPDIFADQGTGGFVVLGNAVARAIEN